MVNNEELIGSTGYLTLWTRCRVTRCRYNRVRLFSGIHWWCIYRHIYSGSCSFTLDEFVGRKWVFQWRHWRV